MNAERFKKIIAYSKNNRDDINSYIKNFYSFAGIEPDNDVLNIMQIVRASFHKKGFLVIEMPFADNEIGALYYKGDGLGYIVINSSLPKVNVNFAISHEIYHVFFQKEEVISKVEFANELYYEHEDEFAANSFAGMFLMPEVSFRRMYTKFSLESDNEIDIIIKLMAYYEVTYMSVLIRCYELGLPAKNNISEELLNVDKELIHSRFDELWLDSSILSASHKDDYPHVESLVKKQGEEYINDGYINERSLEKVLINMHNLYNKIKGE